MKTKLTRASFIPSGYRLYKFVDGMYEAHISTTTPHTAIFFFGKRTRPAWHYRFDNHANAIARINKSIADVHAWNEKKVARRAEAKKPHSLKVDDILYSSWGYEQTNINFYKVVGVKGKQTIELSAIGSRIVDGSGGPTTYVVADETRTLNEKILTKRASSDNNVKITSYATASPWDGKPKYETGAGWGH